MPFGRQAHDKLPCARWGLVPTEADLLEHEQQHMCVEDSPDLYELWSALRLLPSFFSFFAIHFDLCRGSTSAKLTGRMRKRVYVYCCRYSVLPLEAV